MTSIQNPIEKTRAFKYAKEITGGEDSIHSDDLAQDLLTRYKRCDTRQQYMIKLLKRLGFEHVGNNIYTRVKGGI